MAAMEATWWLNDHLHAWLGRSGAADALALPAPHNIAAAMGLDLLDVADVIRPHPEVVAFLRDGPDDGFLDELPELDGGAEARDAILAYLDTYGMRCVGEIDITRPRWSEQPSALVPMILADIDNAPPGDAERRVEDGRRRAHLTARNILDRLRHLPDGDAKATATERMIDRVRTFIGYRGYPKYGVINRYFVYKQALLDEARRLVDAAVVGVERATDLIHHGDQIRVNGTDGHVEILTRGKKK